MFWWKDLAATFTSRLKGDCGDREGLWWRVEMEVPLIIVVRSQVFVRQGLQVSQNAGRNDFCGKNRLQATTLQHYKWILSNMLQPLKANYISCFGKKDLIWLECETCCCWGWQGKKLGSIPLEFMNGKWLFPNEAVDKFFNIVLCANNEAIILDPFSLIMEKSDFYLLIVELFDSQSEFELQLDSDEFEVNNSKDSLERIKRFRPSSQTRTKWQFR